MISHGVRIAIAGLATSLALPLPTPAVAHAGGSTTTWQPATGNWSEGANWSAGEPGTAHTAEIPPQSIATIDQTGESCLELHVGTGSKGFGAQVYMTQGSLMVGDMVRVGTAASFTTGVFTQIGGTVTASLLLAERGGYTAGGGTTTLTECVLDGGALTLGPGANVTVTTDITVESGSTFTVGGGTLVAGTGPSHDVTVRGEIAFVNPSVTITLQNLTLEGSNSRLRVTIGALGVDTTTIDGTFLRDGRFIVNEVSAADGRYDVLTAGAITGAFTMVELPDGWSWGIDGTTLWVEKGAVPVRTTTWGGIKRGFTE